MRYPLAGERKNPQYIAAMRQKEDTMSNKLFASKSVRKAIMKAMTPSQRRWMKEGEIFAVRIIRKGKELKRWGADNNMAKIAVGGKCCKIYKNNLEDLAWNNNPEEARKEAVIALNYFVYGDEDEYKVVIM